MRYSLPVTLPSSLLSDEARRRLNHPGVIVSALLAVPLLAALLCYAAWISERRADAREHALQAQVKQRLADLSRAPVAETAPYAERLPVEPYAVSRAIEHLRAAAEAQSVNVTTISATERAASPATLGRVTLDFTLRGGYVAIKAVLNELLSRDAQRVVLQQMSLRRSTANPAAGASSGDVEAQISVSWLHRPLAAGSAGSAGNDKPSPMPMSAASAASAPSLSALGATAASAPVAAAPASATKPASTAASTPRGPNAQLKH